MNSMGNVILEPIMDHLASLRYLYYFIMYIQSVYIGKAYCTLLPAHPYVSYQVLVHECCYVVRTNFDLWGSVVNS